MPTTLVQLDEGKPPVAVELPAGFSRVWEGTVRPGDMYLNRLAALAGRTEWVRITFDKIVENDDVYDTAGWYSCVIRECDREVGRPCETCGFRAPLSDFGEESRLCDVCSCEAGAESEPDTERTTPRGSA